MNLLKFIQALLTLIVGTLAVCADRPAFEAAQTDSRRLTLAPNLQLKVWAAEPLLSNGVAFSFNNQGECFIAETHRYGISVFDITKNTDWLLNDLSFRNTQDRLEFLERTFATNHSLLTRDSEAVRVVRDTDHDGTADLGQLYATGFNSPLDGTAAGVVSRGKDVWFGNIPGLWHLHPSASGAIVKEELFHGFGVHIGVTGHDLHGLTFGPDGRLYMSFGDRGACVTNREGRVIELPDTGGVLRCEPNGAHLEVFCMGLRNPQDLEFDDAGNLWTVDNDTAGADPCRVLHLVEGADYGWRCSYQHMEGFGPWVNEELWRGGKEGIMPLAGTVSQGPAGLAFYPGTGFGDTLAGKFLHCDFPAGVWSFDVKPKGASYILGHADKFAWNCWPTDVKFGPDGAAYILDWVAGWDMPQKGRIYRISDPRFDNQPESIEVRDLLASGISKSNARRLVTLLSHKDRRVRLEAQYEAVRRSLPGQASGASMASELEKAAQDDRSPVAQVHAINGLENIIRLGGNGTLDFGKLLASADPHVRAVAARAAGDRLDKRAVTPLINLVTDTAPEVRLAALLALSKFAVGRDASGLNPAVATRTALDALRANTDDDLFIQHGAVSLLAATARPKLLETAARDPLVRVRLGVLLTWRRNKTGAIVQFLSDPDPAVVDEAVHAIHSVPIAPEFPALANLISRVDCPTNSLSRVIDAAYRLGTEQHAQMLTSYAKRHDAPAWARVLALHALADWEKPSPIDRVNGLWRPLVSARKISPFPSAPAEAPAEPPNPLLERRLSPADAGSPRMKAPALAMDLGRSVSFDDAMTIKRGGQPATRALLRVASEILDPNTPDEFGVVIGGPPARTEVQLAVVATAVKLRAKEVSTALYARLIDTNSPRALQLAIIPALAELHAGQADSALTMAINSPDPEFQATAVRYLDRLQGADTIGLLGGTIKRLVSEAPLDKEPPADSQIFLAQAAIDALGKATNDAAGEILDQSLKLLVENRLPTSLALDLTAAATRRGGSVVNVALERQAHLIQLNPALGRYWDTRIGGNRVRGSRVFHQKVEVECLRCHSIQGAGGTVGPALDGVGRRSTVDQILESIVLPSARFATGFEMASLELKNGHTLVGRIKKETGTTLVIESNGETGELESTEVAKSNIQKRSAAPSPMPDGLADKLTPFELRDLISYLLSLK